MRQHKVLVGLDESATASRALQWALARAARAKDELWALAVLDTRAVLLEARRGAMPAGPGPSYAERLQGLVEQAKGSAAGHGVVLHAEVRPSDDPAGALVAFAREGSFDEIVLGHREKKGVEKVVLGSTALRVLELTAMPVTIVR
jgi:nucleotide-binding universal stress UspA family protein